MPYNYQKIYLTLYFSSLIIFVINLLLQGQIYFSYYDSLGLILKISPIIWLGYAILLILIYFQFVNYRKIDQKFVFLTFLLLIVYLIGTPFFYEYLPRFPDTWTHSYIAQKMFETGNVVNNLSGYEEYPGSFLFYGVLFQILPPYLVMKFFPPLFYVIGVVTIYLLFKHFFDSKVSFLASVLYLFFNWTVEDNHLSPQFLVLNIYFIFMLVLIKMLSIPKKYKMPYVFLSFLLIPVIVFSHPGTPIFLILILGSMLIICKRLRTLTLLSLFIFLVLVYSTYTYFQSIYFESYISHFNQFLELLRFGQLGGATERLSTSSSNRIIFLASRLGITFFSVALGILGIHYIRKRGYKTEANLLIGWSFAMLVFSIFVSVALKGEYYERFVLISSLPLAAVCAYFMNKSKFPGIIILIILLLISPLYFIAKYGNEAFESVSLEKLKAECFSLNYYDHCDENQEIVDSPLDYSFLAFGSSYFTVSREGILATSVYQNMEQSDVNARLESIVVNNTLDKIYSTNNVMVYK